MRMYESKDTIESNIEFIQSLNELKDHGKLSDCACIAEAYVSLSKAYLKKTMCTEAEDALSTAIFLYNTLTPCSTVQLGLASAHRLLGTIHHHKGSHEQAIPQYDCAMNLLEMIQQTSPSCSCNLLRAMLALDFFRLYQDTGKSIEAKQHLDQSCAVISKLSLDIPRDEHPRYLDVLRQHIYALLEVRRLDSVFEVFNQMLDFLNLPVTNMGYESFFCEQILRKLKEQQAFDVAIRIAEAILTKTNPNLLDGWLAHKVAYEAKGVCLSAKGQYDDALWAYMQSNEILVDYICRITPELDKERMRLLRKVSDTLSLSGKPLLAKHYSDIATKIWLRSDD